MSWFEDAIGNVGTFLGINPDTKKKKPQVVQPTNTLRQQVVRPVQNVAAPIQSVDRTASIREQAVRNNQAEQERKRREEAARLAAIAQQARQVKQVAPVALTSNRVPINNLGLPASPLQPTGNEQKKQAVIEQVRKGITPSNVPVNYVLKNNTPLSKSDFKAAVIEGSKQKINDELGTPFERAQAQVGGIDLASMAQALARIPETAVRSGAELLDNTITKSGASYSNDSKNEGLLRILYGRNGLQTYGKQGAEGKKALQESDLGFLKDTGNVLPPELIGIVLAALDIPILQGAKVAGGLGVKATKLAITTATDAVRKKTEETIGRELTKAELKEIADRTKKVVTNVPEQPVDALTTPQTDVNGYKPISNNAVNGLVKGGPGAAINILRASGRRLNPDVERALAEQLSYAKTPEQVNDVLKNAGIPTQETPAQALARQKASGEQVAAEQTKALENASTPVVAQEPVPAAANGVEQKAAPSADIAQNDVAPQVTKTPADQLAEARQTPIDKRTPEQIAEVTRLEGEAKTAKDASDFLAVKQKLENNEPLTPKEERIYQKVMGTPQEKGAVNRALTPEAQRKPEPTTPVNPALNIVDGKIKVQKKGGVASNNTAQIRETLIKEGDKINTHFGDKIRQVENLARKIEDITPEFGKHVEDFRDFASKGAADVVRTTDKNTAVMSDAFGGKNIDQQRMTQYLVENLSNKKLVAKYAKTNPEELAAARTFAAWAKENLPIANQMFRSLNMKEIGNIKDYFPHMMKLNKSKNPLSDMLIASAESTNTMGEARISKGFMKTRKDIAGGKELSPADAANLYARQIAQVIHLTPVVARGNAIIDVIQKTKNLHPQAKQDLVDFFTQITNQVAGKGTTPITGLGKAAAKIRNVASQSSIMGSVNSIYAQIANPTAVLSRMFADGGIVAGSKDGFKLLVNSAKTIGKKVKDLEMIDGMSSDYLVTARGAKATGKHVGNRITDAGYKFSNFGDLQSKHAAVQTIYDRIRTTAPDLPKEQALRQAERDVKFAIGDRTMGERSAFTASANPAAIIASQYQIEQIANVMNFIDGTVLNPRIGPWKKIVGTMAAAAGAYGANQVTGAISNGQVKPVPDVIGAGLDAYSRVQDMQEQRKKNGEDPLTPEQQAGLFATNFGASFISNLPLGRTALTPVNAAVEALGNNKDINNPNLASDLGLNPRDTNPLQTLPAVGLVSSTVDSVGKGLSGKQTPLETGLDLASKVIPGGGQIKKTVGGIATFAQGGSAYPDTKNADGTITPGDQKFKVNNDLSSLEGWHNLLAMATSGQFANRGAQDYIKSGFKTQAQRDINAGNITPDKVSSLTDPQYEAYKTATSKQFIGQLSDSDKKIYQTMQNSTLLKRNLADGKITQDQVDAINTQKNKYLFEKGLTAEINTGYTREDMQKFAPEVQAYLTDKAISGKSKYKDAATTDASKAVIALATAPDEAWPTVTDVKPTNALAEKYVTYQKELSEAVGDQASQFTARKKFWSAAVKQNFDSKAVGIYDSSDEGGTTNSKATYGMSIANIKKLASPEGMTVGKENYKINKKDLDAMVELDNRLLKAGLISKPKFSNKTRGAFGYGDAPTSEIDGLGYTGDSIGRKGSDRTGVGSLLTSYGGGSIKGFSDLPNKQTSTPKLDIAQFQNTGKRAGKSSITIKL